MIRPVCRYILFSRLNIFANKKLPASPKGTESMTARGTNRLSYNAQRIRYMKTTKITNTSVVVLPVFYSSRVRPPISYPYPVGNVCAATS